MFYNSKTYSKVFKAMINDNVVVSFLVKLLILGFNRITAHPNKRPVGRYSYKIYLPMVCYSNEYGIL